MCTYYSKGASPPEVATEGIDICLVAAVLEGYPLNIAYHCDLGERWGNRDSSIHISR